MFPILNNEKGRGKPKQSESSSSNSGGFLKKKSFSLLSNNNSSSKQHARSQSSNSTTNDVNSTASSTLSLENNNKRGWLTEPTVVASRSVEKQTQQKIPVPIPATVDLRKPIITNISQKDILGAVSDEDIFKLTELTSRLPEVNTSSLTKQKHQRQRSEQQQQKQQQADENNTMRRRRNPSEQELPSPPKAAPTGDSHDLVTNTNTTTMSNNHLLSNRITSASPKPITTPSPSTSSPTTISTIATKNSSDMDTPDESKRKSWLHKQILQHKISLNGNKKSSTSVMDHQAKEEDPRSEAASFVEEYHHRQSSSFESNRGGEEEALTMTRSSSSSTNSNKLLGGLTKIKSDSFKKKLKSSSKRLSTHHRSHSVNNKNNKPAAPIVTATKTITTIRSKKGHRRHSFDSFQSSAHIKKDNTFSSEDEEEASSVGKDQQMLQQANWDQDRMKKEPYFESAERPNFRLVLSDPNLHDEYINAAPNEEEEEALYSQVVSENESSDQEEEERRMTGGTSTPAIMMENDTSQVKIVMFDYASLPDEIKSLIDCYQDDGKVEIKKMIVKKSSTSSEEDEEEDEDEDESILENTVDYKDLITGLSPTQLQQQEREIAIVTADTSDNIEFTKLIQVATLDDTHGPLLDLHVSLFGQDSDSNLHQDLLETILHVDKRIEIYQQVLKDSTTFLEDHTGTLQDLHVFDSYLQPQVISTSSTQRRDPFDERKIKVASMIQHIQNEMQQFQDGLKKTEELVKDVQVDMDDTRNRMETYIKDIPESHYSALKKLEVDIESILSKRAKNPWLDTGYALLSYILTLFALVVWIIIYILKLGKKVILFPRQLWKAYSDYLVERNTVVKTASMQSVAGTFHQQQQRASSISRVISADTTSSRKSK